MLELHTNSQIGKQKRVQKTHFPSFLLTNGHFEEIGKEVGSHATHINFSF